MDRTKLTRYGIIAIIVFFAFEFLWPFLYAPVQDQATPTPTPSAITQNLTAITQARVVTLGNRMLLICSEPITIELKKQLEALPGVSRVLQSANILDVTLSPEANNATGGVNNNANEITALFSDSCSTGVAYLKADELAFAGAVSFNSTQGKPQPIRLPATLCKQNNWNCLVFATTQQNATVTVSVDIKESDTGEQGIVEEIPGVQPKSNGNATNPESPTPTFNQTATAGNSTNATNSS